MKIRMTHRSYAGDANVEPQDQATWEAAGWVAEQVASKPTPETKGKAK